MEERPCAYLSSRCALVVLDNCEHLVDAAAGLVRQLLTRCPDVTVLATSREVLGLPERRPGWCPAVVAAGQPAGARDLVGSDAVALFCDRARAAHAGFDLTDEAAAPWRRSATGSTASPSRSSWPPPACGCWAHTSWPTVSTTASGSCGAGPVAAMPGTRRCGR